MHILYILIPPVSWSFRANHFQRYPPSILLVAYDISYIPLIVSHDIPLDIVGKDMGNNNSIKPIDQSHVPKLISYMWTIKFHRISTILRDSCVPTHTYGIFIVFLSINTLHGGSMFHEGTKTCLVSVSIIAFLAVSRMPIPKCSMYYGIFTYMTGSFWRACR